VNPRGWRILPFETGCADDLLERSATLLDALAGDPTPALRWYRSARPALVLGRGQSGSDIEAGDLPVHTRSSGGGAVVMDGGLLSLDILVPAGHPLLGSGGIGDVFLPVGRSWAAALADLGLTDVTVHDGPAGGRRQGTSRERLLAAVCYATLGRGEVAVGGRKIVGLSQRRRRPGALIQCGLLRRWRPEVLLAALGADPADPEIHAAAVGLDDLVDPAPTDELVMAAVTNHVTR
jgi:lipoate---protein ligase